MRYKHATPPSKRLKRQDGRNPSGNKSQEKVWITPLGNVYISADCAALWKKVKFCTNSRRAQSVVPKARSWSLKVDYLPPAAHWLKSQGALAKSGSACRVGCRPAKKAAAKLSTWRFNHGIPRTCIASYAEKRSHGFKDGRRIATSIPQSRSTRMAWSSEDITGTALAASYVLVAEKFKKIPTLKHIERTTPLRSRSRGLT